MAPGPSPFPSPLAWQGSCTSRILECQVLQHLKSVPLHGRDPEDASLNPRSLLLWKNADTNPKVIVCHGGCKPDVCDVWSVGSCTKSVLGNRADRSNKPAPQPQDVERLQRNKVVHRLPSKSCHTVAGGWVRELFSGETPTNQDAVSVSLTCSPSACSVRILQGSQLLGRKGPRGEEQRAGRGRKGRNSWEVLKSLKWM